MISDLDTTQIDRLRAENAQLRAHLAQMVKRWRQAAGQENRVRSWNAGYARGVEACATELRALADPPDAPKEKA